MSNMGFSLNVDGGLRFSAMSDFEKSKKYTDEEIKIKSISLNGSELTPDKAKNVDIDFAFDGIVTLTEINDQENFPRTKGIFKIIQSGNFSGILISAGVPATSALSNKQIKITGVGYSTNYIQCRNWDNTNNKWKDWEIIKPHNSENATGLLDISPNEIYSIDRTGAYDDVLIRLPEAQVGDFAQYDFVTGSRIPTVYIDSLYGMTELDLTPEANKIYSLFFDWGIIGVSDGANVYGWRISYAEYEYNASSSGSETEVPTVEDANDEDL